jgi:hypothetical protein
MANELAIPEYNPATDDWNTLVHGVNAAGEIVAAPADEALGSDFLKDDAADKLIGVPLVIYRVTYREGFQRKGIAWKDDYVSCEAVIAPQNVLQERARKGRLTLADVSVDPGEHIGFNDGSTGIYREITNYLNARGFISLPTPLIEKGEKGDSSYDLPRSQWLTGADAATAGIPVRLHCPRGLRYSEYKNDYAPDGAKTSYIG